MIGDETTEGAAPIHYNMPSDQDVIRVEHMEAPDDAGPEDAGIEATEGAAMEEAVELDNSIEARIAHKIREDSELHGRPTLVNDLEALFRDDDPNVDFSVMQQDERYQDIQLALSPAGALYIYSTQYLTEEAAVEKSALEDLMSRIADQVRRDSRYDVKLTKLEDLNGIAPDLSAESPILSQMAQDERYSDIATITASNGMTFLFSEALITRNYATILARAEANDPLAQIAATVREESKLYPRPTEIETFKQAVFGIDPAKIEDYVAQLLQSREYADIKQVKASNGAVFLYSTEHLTEAYAQSLAEWAAVGQYENP